MGSGENGPVRSPTGTATSPARSPRHHIIAAPQASLGPPARGAVSGTDDQRRRYIRSPGRLAALAEFDFHFPPFAEYGAAPGDGGVHQVVGHLREQLLVPVSVRCWQSGPDRWVVVHGSGSPLLCRVVDRRDQSPQIRQGEIPVHDLPVSRSDYVDNMSPVCSHRFGCLRIASGATVRGDGRIQKPKHYRQSRRVKRVEPSRIRTRSVG